jgi:hypothetical protein
MLKRRHNRDVNMLKRSQEGKAEHNSDVEMLKRR